MNFVISTDFGLLSRQQIGSTRRTDAFPLRCETFQHYKKGSQLMRTSQFGNDFQFYMIIWDFVASLSHCLVPQPLMLLMMKVSSVLSFFVHDKNFTNRNKAAIDQ